MFAPEKEGALFTIHEKLNRGDAFAASSSMDGWPCRRKSSAERPILSPVCRCGILCRGHNQKKNSADMAAGLDKFPPHVHENKVRGCFCCKKNVWCDISSGRGFSVCVLRVSACFFLGCVVYVAGTVSKATPLFFSFLTRKRAME